MKTKLSELILELFYPPKCVFCGTVLKSGDICNNCIEELPYTRGEAVYQNFPCIEKCVSPLYYKDNVRESILRFKFGGCESYARRFGKIMTECAENNLDCGSISMISCIPLSKKRLRTRGYNQAELLAEEIAFNTRIPYCPTLIKTRDNAVQSTIRDAKQRARNVSGAYSVINESDVKGETILLVDDVTTTGATLSECARVLRKSGAKEILAVTLARHEDQ